MRELATLIFDANIHGILMAVNGAWSGHRHMTDCRKCFYLVTVPVYEHNYSWQWYAGDAYRCAYYDKVIVTVTRKCNMFTDIANTMITRFLYRRESNAKRIKVRQ
jgi:hypothetical protein